MASKIEVDEIFNAGGDNDTGIDLATNDAVKIKIANAVKAEVDSSGHVKLDTVKGYTSAASVSVVGEGGSTTTNLQQGLIKVWCSQDGTASNAAAYDSFNVSGTTDNGTGDYHINLTNAHTDTTFSVALSSGQYHTGWDGNTTSSSVNIAAYNTSHAYVDANNAFGQTFGDLA